MNNNVEIMDTLHYKHSLEEQLNNMIFGSIERFLGILIEHYAGAFPLWLAPIQINIIPVNNEYHLDYSIYVKNELVNNGIRVEIDSRDEKLGYRMRESQTKKIPYTLVIGDKEKESNLVNYRLHGSSETISVTILEFIDILKNDVKNYK